ncbi:GPP34-domain-containing protein [Fomitiporia mediterranea MF3/22]|uniref:GPP34-domain-containing protein n=1 Tax=Fomitiporia mediterranea (strain MF3/22) TaxID=694068 RepID=UPI0004408952|nr:GPP34-domain-containing protein [Fomitiporia mediterranea MF3/22]EJC99094.1 GPP34-domain-containing protein [Fomitiporia mediterranea MF3/22]
MSSSGLQRRRAAGASSSAQDEEFGGAWSSTSTSRNDVNGSGASSPGPTTPNGNGIGGAVHAGTAFEGGSKVAYDPRDLELEDAEARSAGGKMPRLTIMEEVLLLGIKDKQGYLSFWNDNISYALRGCILIELALRRRIAISRDPARKRVPLSERVVEVLDARPTGETLLDEALRMMVATSAHQTASVAPASSTATASAATQPEFISVNTWIDLLSGETWNLMKIGFQLKQVRERLAKGLVDKGVLRTEKRNFLLFDMATHPVADARTKEGIVRRVTTLLSAQTRAVPPAALGKEGEQCRAMRAVALCCASYAASVLDNCFTRLTYEDREAAFSRAEDILGEFAAWPFGASSSSSSSGPSARRREGTKIGTGSSGGSGTPGRESILGLVDAVKGEMHTTGPGVSDGEDRCFELIAAVLDVLSRLDSLL